jgi:hypothetical protein
MSKSLSLLLGIVLAGSMTACATSGAYRPGTTSGEGGGGQSTCPITNLENIDPKLLKDFLSEKVRTAHMLVDSVQSLRAISAGLNKLARSNWSRAEWQKNQARFDQEIRIAENSLVVASCDMQNAKVALQKVQELLSAAIGSTETLPANHEGSATSLRGLVDQTQASIEQFPDKFDREEELARHVRQQYNELDVESLTK